MENQSKSVLILGKPKSAKTVFLAQLAAIANKGSSKISFWKKPDIDAHLKSAIERIRNGEEPESTHADSSFQISLPIKYNGVNHELRCPDYGGEQVNSIVKFRELSQEWLREVRNSNTWVLFIRLNSIEKNFDLTTKNPDETSGAPSTATKYKMSDDAFFVDLLQILSYAKNLDTTAGQLPKVVLALTCFDEIDLKKETTPTKIFNDALPLLSQFLSSNWIADNVKVIGISALGFNLVKEENKNKYIEEGNEKFPFVVASNETSKIHDLTHALYEIMST